jgi:hypothetical protein
MGLDLCLTLSSSINTMIRSSPACLRKKKVTSFHLEAIYKSPNKFFKFCGSEEKLSFMSMPCSHLKTMRFIFY